MYFKAVAIARCQTPRLHILQTLKSYTLKRNSLLIEQIFLIDLLAPVGGTRKSLQSCFGTSHKSVW